MAGTPGSESSARGSTSEMNKRPKLGRRQAALSGGNWVAGGGIWMTGRGSRHGRALGRKRSKADLATASSRAIVW